MQFEHDLLFAPTKQLKFYDSVNSLQVFRAPQGRNFDEFLQESKKLGYLSFRESEVNWDNVRVLVNGNLVTVDGTFLGRVEPDSLGNRYAVNLSAVAGRSKDNWLESLIPDPKDKLTSEELTKFY